MIVKEQLIFLRLGQLTYGCFQILRGKDSFPNDEVPNIETAFVKKRSLSTMIVSYGRWKLIQTICAVSLVSPNHGQ